MSTIREENLEGIAGGIIFVDRDMGYPRFTVRTDDDAHVFILRTEVWWEAKIAAMDHNVSTRIVEAPE